MKKALFLLGLVLAVLTASAQQTIPMDDDPLFDPEGTDEGYIMSYTENNGFYEQSLTNGKVMVRRNGSTYYFNGLTPGGNRSYKGAPESWLVGEQDGNEIVIKAGQVLVENQSKKLYLEIVHADADGNVTSYENEARLTIGDNGELTAAADDIFAIYEHADNEEDRGFFGFFYKLELKPMGELVRFSFPKGVTPQTYVLSGYDMYEAKQSRFVKVAFNDGKFYISGLASKSPDEVYEGTYEGSVAKIPAFQIVKDADLFYYRIVPTAVDKDFNYEFLYNFTFNMSADRHELTLAPDGTYLCETAYDLQSFASTLSNVSIKYYAGDRAAKPATPVINEWDSYNDALSFEIPTEDVNGEYINPDNLAYRFYTDGQLYTFSTADYERIENDMTEIPFGYTDNFDIVNNGTQKIVYFHNLDAKKLYVESVYTVDGRSTVSDRAMYDFDPTGISTSTAALQPTEVYYTSLLGARLNAPAKGSIVLKTTVYADGSRSTAKHVVK